MRELQYQLEFGINKPINFINISITHMRTPDGNTIYAMLIYIHTSTITYNLPF